MNKENLIHRITLLDTGSYRRDIEGNTYRHEPPEFRSTLFEVYNKLSEEDLEILLKTRLQ
jgi:hypothetical protein